MNKNTNTPLFSLHKNDHILKKTKNINISNINKYFVHVSIFRFVLVNMFVSVFIKIFNQICFLYFLNSLHNFNTFINNVDS